MGSLKSCRHLAEIEFGNYLKQLVGKQENLGYNVWQLVSKAVGRLEGCEAGRQGWWRGYTAGWTGVRERPAMERLVSPSWRNYIPSNLTGTSSTGPVLIMLLGLDSCLARRPRESANRGINTHDTIIARITNKVSMQNRSQHHG